MTLLDFIRLDLTAIEDPISFSVAAVGTRKAENYLRAKGLEDSSSGESHDPAGVPINVRSNKEFFKAM